MTPDSLINNLMMGIPSSWDGEDSPESICLEYVRAIEWRLLALGGSLEKHSEDAGNKP